MEAVIEKETNELVSQCINMASDILRMSAKQIWIDYDRKSQKATETIEYNGDILLRKDGQKVIGLTILNAALIKKRDVFCMNYRLEYISEDDFEKLVNMVCHEILGCGVIEFTKGKDGGRDGKFRGVANKFPSEREPWNGKFIIQAKHTDNPISSCSDKDFQRKIKNEEIPKLLKLKNNNELDNYLLFTNRKLSGIKGTSLVQEIKKEVGVDNVEIIGKEVINRYLSKYKHITKEFNLDRYILPFEFTDSDLKELVVEFTKEIKSDKERLKMAVEHVKKDFTYIDKDQKNIKNKLGKEYFEIIKDKSLLHFAKIDDFLQHPINSELSDMYMDSAFELQNLISVKRDEFGAFEEIFVIIYNLVCDSNPKLRNKRFIYVFLHYMYFNCDIGQK